MPRLRLVRSTAAPVDTAAASASLADAGLRVRPWHADDVGSLAAVLLDAYRGGPEAEENTLEEAATEVGRTVGGDYGRFMTEASFVAVDRDGQPVGATLLTYFEEVPLVAHAIVNPAGRGHGTGTMLLAASINALAASGEPEAHLAVSAANRAAARLYLRLGFEPQGDHAAGRWTSDAHITAAEQIFRSTMDGFVTPRAHGIAVVQLGVEGGAQAITLPYANVEATDSEVGGALPALALGFATGYRNGAAVVELDMAELDAAIALLGPTCDHPTFDRRDLDAWREVRDLVAQPGPRGTRARMVAVFSDGPDGGAGLVDAVRNSTVMG